MTAILKFSRQKGIGGSSYGTFQFWSITLASKNYISTCFGWLWPVQTGLAQFSAHDK